MNYKLTDYQVGEMPGPEGWNPVFYTVSSEDDSLVFRLRNYGDGGPDHLHECSRDGVPLVGDEARDLLKELLAWCADRQPERKKKIAEAPPGSKKYGDTPVLEDLGVWAEREHYGD